MAPTLEPPQQKQPQQHKQQKQRSLTPPRLTQTPKRLLNRLFRTGTTPARLAGTTGSGTSSNSDSNHNCTTKSTTTRTINNKNDDNDNDNNPSTKENNHVEPSVPSDMSRTPMTTKGSRYDAASAAATTTPTSPVREDYDSSPECFGGGGVAMKSPGMAIPTPSMGYEARHRGTMLMLGGGGGTGTGTAIGPLTSNHPHHNLTTSLIFPHPLTVRTNHSQGASLDNPIFVDEDADEPRLPSSSISPSHYSSPQRHHQLDFSTVDSDDDDDEEAFLPQDCFLPPFTTTTATKTSASSSSPTRRPPQFSWDQVQEHIRKANETLKQQLQEEHEEALQQALETHLREHGMQWKRDSEAEYARLRGLIQQEQDKVSSQTVKLQEMQQQTSDLKTQFNSTLEQYKANQTSKDGTIQQLQQQIQLMKKELNDVTLQSSSRIEEVQRIVQSEKADLEQQLKDAQQLLQKQMEQEQQATKTHAVTVQELQTRITTLQGLSEDYESVKMELSQLHSQHHVQQTHHEEALVETAKTTRERHEQEMKELKTALEQVHVHEISRLQAQVNELQAAKDAQEKLQQVEEELNRLRIEYQDEKYEIVRSHSEQADELQTQLSIKQQEYDEALEDLKIQATEWKEQVERLQLETQSHTRTVQDLQAKLDHAHAEQIRSQVTMDSLQLKIRLLQESHVKELNDVKAKAKLEFDEKVQEFELLLQEEKKKDNTNQITALETMVQADKLEYARMVREVKEGHNREIDDLLKQLDLIEAEHEEKMKHMTQLVKEKEAVISALGQQLSDAEDKLILASNEKVSLSQRIEILDEEVASAKDETESKAKDIKRLIAEQARFAEDAAVAREQACADAREEMIQRAEIQFDELNSTYKKLKQKFDEATAKIMEMERDIERANRRVEEIQKEKEIAEADFSNQVAQAKAAVSTADLNAARKVKQYRQELQNAEECRDELQIRLDQALATSRSIQSTLASVVTEKELLLEENKDLKAVSEELLEMVEGRQR